MNLKNKTKNWKLSNFFVNKRYNFNRKRILSYLPKSLIDQAYVEISKWRGYKKTPLIKLNRLSKNLKVGNIYYKDESKRFHLKSFKALGGAYAVKVISKGEKK